MVTSPAPRRPLWAEVVFGTIGGVLLGSLIVVVLHCAEVLP